MRNCWKAVSLLLFWALLLGFTSVASAGTTSAKDSVVIYNPGNAEFSGFRIQVDSSGQATAVDASGSSSNYLHPDLAQRLFADVAAAKPLQQLSSHSCSATLPESASAAEVNAAVIITWDGQRSPMLSCVTDTRASRLRADASAVEHALYVQAYRSRITVTGSNGESGGGYWQPSISEKPNSQGSYYGNGFGGARFVNERFRNEPFTNTRFTVDRFTTTPFTVDRFTDQRFYMDRFANERFSIGRFTNDRFSMERDSFGQSSFSGFSTGNFGSGDFGSGFGGFGYGLGGLTGSFSSGFSSGGFGSGGFGGGGFGGGLAP